MDDLSALAATTRDHLAAERQRLHALLPEALDTTAASFAMLSDELRGEVAMLARHMGRTDRHLRHELAGEVGMPVEDLCGIYLLRPAPVRRAFAWLAADLGADASGSGVAAAGAGLAEAGGAFCANLMRALDDGLLTLAEIQQLQRDLDQLDGLVRNARAELIRRRG